MLNQYSTFSEGETMKMTPEEYQKQIKNVAQHYNEITQSDLQAIALSLAMQTRKDDEKVLKDIKKEVKKQ